MTGAEAILDFLQRQHVYKVFGYPGGAIMPLYDALLDFDIKHYLARHEQGAGFAAIGYARSTNKPGVCFGTSGPGFTNLLTPLADAMLDSVPLLVISGQVASASMGSDAFQEVDSLGLSLSVTKHSFQITHPDEIPEVMEQAYALCMSGRPGPVLVDVPKDILMSEVTEQAFLQATHPAAKNEPSYGEALAQANDLLASAARPLLYLGGGIAMADALTEARQYIKMTGLPLVSSLKGLGTAPPDYPLDQGMLGMHGLRPANMAVNECDLLLVMGARLDDRATGKLAEFAPSARVIHIDIDAAELGKRRQPDVSINADIKCIFNQLFTEFEVPDWLQRIEMLQAQGQPCNADQQGDEQKGLSAEAVLSALNTATGGKAIYTCDVGQHQMWAAQYLKFASPRHHLTSGGLGTMGFGLPAAMGAQAANPDATVVTISGDGSFMMNIQELATAIRYDLPVKVVLFDNQRLGMVKQWQELFHEQRFSETDLSDNPPFTDIARGFGFYACELTHGDNIDAVVAQLIEQKGPALLHVKLNPQDNVWPIVPPNTGNAQMLEQQMVEKKMTEQQYD
ncbi:MAG: acetolactate synthase 2 catalytic subunit [Alteromonadaceae bacterium]|nr:acetolactate synthase 2 catalytic subunit [Alteromonadaceae bacterium]